MFSNNYSFYLKTLLGLFLFLIPCVIHGEHFDPNASYQVYFTPTHDCTSEIVRAISGARQTIYVQAYFLTAEPILSALLAAKTRLVDVRVVLDKNHAEHEAGIKRMLQADIPVWIDKSYGIAHNKIMIIDEQQVITGSFNFTYSAGHRNRENLLIIKDKQFARYYLENWHRCQMRAVQEAPLRKQANKKVENTSQRSEMDRLWDMFAHFIISILHALGILLDNG